MYKKMNCWEFMRCGREAGGRNIDQLGICPAYPEEGQRCANVVGTFCDLVKALLLQSIRAARSVLFITAFILIKIPGWPIRQQNNKKSAFPLKRKAPFCLHNKTKITNRRVCRNCESRVQDHFLFQPCPQKPCQLFPAL